ncbi:MAG: WecB/TagA/CpsF family glycosyltransferase, partial [Chlorobium sp.]|nr:WecB/TagA/CpsF family glycosyltransferase [Chlorobium sp.]
VVWASHILGTPLPERVAGIDLMMGMLERGQEKGYRVYLLGATEEINQTVANRIKADYPGVIVAGRRNGYFTPDDEEAIANDIARTSPDILLVAITSP